MSSAGHVMDMVQRFNNNRNLQLERHSQYAKVKKAYQKSELKHMPLEHRSKISKAELEIIKQKIRRDARNSFKRRIILTLYLSPIALIILCVVIWKVISNWSL